MNKFLILRLKSTEAENNFFENFSKKFYSLVQFEINLTGIFKLSENVILVSLQSADPFSCGNGFHIKNNSGLVFDGFPTANGDLVSTDGLVASNLLERAINAKNPNDFYNDLEGEYSIAFFEENEKKLCAFSDYSGLKPLFYIDNEQYTAISNRQFLLNPLCANHNQPEFDLTAAISLVVQGNKFGKKSIHKDVQLLGTGEYLESDGNGFLSIKRFDQQLWNIFDKGSAIDYDGATQSLIRNFDWMANNQILKNNPLRISLTGGEDSRLVLAIAMQSRAKNSISTFTYGYEDNPDILTAPIVAEAAGVPHEKIIHKKAPPSEANLESIWKNLRSHTFRYEGMPGAWDGGGGPAKNSTLDITGLFDFFYKRVRPYNASVDLSSIEQTLQHFLDFQQPNDPLNLLSEHQSKEQKAEILEWIHEKLDQGASLNDLPEIYYQENRICWWAGAINSNIQSKIRISPLSSRVSAATALRQSVNDRRDRRFIFEVMKRTAPKLLEIPYLNKQWPNSILGLAKNITLPTTQFSFEKKPDSSVPWQVSFVKKGSKQIRSFLLDNSHSGIFDVFNQKKIIDVLTNPDLITNTPTVKALLNLVQIQILLTKSWTIEKDSIVNHNLKETGFKTNINWIENKIKEKNNPNNFKKKCTLKRKTIYINIPEGAENFRIDPLNIPGNLFLNSITAKLWDETKYNYTVSTIRCNKQLEMKNNYELVSIGDDPHFFVVHPEDNFLKRVKELVVDIELPENIIFEVFFDFGKGFTREQMYSKTFLF